MSMISSIRYTSARCPLGYVLAASGEKGLSALFLGENETDLYTELRREFPSAELRRDDEGMAHWMTAIVDHLHGRQPQLDLPLDVEATAFQRRVWRELQAIPYGETRSYSALARALGQPNAVRAVARACATNPVSLVVPCHRVIRTDGGLGGYRWGLERKRKLLAYEKEMSTVNA
jgi:AraC family transcriptional regulator of adaptative response/methylated-DNA-[protein]-cysteine methyltransferase